MVNQISVFLMLCIHFLFMSHILYNYGLISSISNSYYQLKGRDKVLFTLWAVLLGAFIMGLNYGSITGLLSGLGLWIVAVSPLYKNEVIKFPHFIGAGISAISIHIDMLFNEYYLLFGLSIGSIIISLYFFFWKKYLIFIEENIIFAFAFIYLILRFIICK